MKVTGVVLLPFLLFVGCATQQSMVGPSSVTPAVPPETERPLDTLAFEAPEPVGPIGEPGDVTEQVPGGSVDWSTKKVRARGTGVVDPGAENVAQARLMAERAAVVVAQRNLLEIVKGVNVDSETKVLNFMTEYDVVYTRVEGRVKGARQLGPPKYDAGAGTVEVELEIDLFGQDGLSDALTPGLGVQAAVAAASPRTREFFEQYSGLVVDGGEAGLKPALFPKIYDEDGNLLLDTKQYAGSLGEPGRAAVQFVEALDKVLARPEFAKTPLVLKAKQVRGSLGADIVLSRNDVDKLGWLRDGFKYLVGAGRFILKVLL